MRIAYVSRYYAPLTGRNIGAYIYHISRLMAANGHEVYLVTDAFGPAVSSPQTLDLRLTIVPTLPGDSEHQHLAQIHEYSHRVYHTLDHLHQRTSLDVIEFSDTGAEGFMTIRAKRLLNIFAHTKLIVHLYSPTSILSALPGCTPSPITFQHSIGAYAERYCANHADLLITTTDAVAACVSDLAIDSSRIYRTLPPIFPGSSRTATSLPRRDPHKVVFVGTLRPQKGVDLFVEAAQLILHHNRDFTFEIYGSDTPSGPFGTSYKAYLETQITAALRPRIQFKGPIPYEQVLAVYRSASFCLLPSRWEGTSYVCLEAMSHGCIVIGSRHGGIPDLIQDGVTGFLVDPYDTEGLAAAVMSNARRTSRLRDLRHTARSSVKQLSDPAKTSRAIASAYSAPIRRLDWRTTYVAPRVSVIVPLYNQGQYLRDSLESVKASSYKNIEVVIVNDGSTDAYTNAVFEQLRSVQKLRQPNKGLAAARNAGIRLSSGSLIMPLDADDLIHPLYIEKGVEALMNNPTLSYVACHAANFGEFDSVYVPVGCVPELMLYMNTDGRCTSLFRREAIEAIGGYDERTRYYEDWDLIISLNKRGFTGDILPMELFRYRRHRDSMVYREVNARRAEGIQYLMQKHQDVLAMHWKLTVLNLVHLWKTRFEANQSVGNIISGREGGA